MMCSCGGVSLERADEIVRRPGEYHADERCGRGAGDSLAKERAEEKARSDAMGERIVLDERAARARGGRCMKCGRLVGLKKDLCDECKRKPMARRDDDEKTPGGVVR